MNGVERESNVAQHLLAKIVHCTGAPRSKVLLPEEEGDGRE